MSSCLLSVTLMLLSFIDCQLGDLKEVTDDLKDDKNPQTDTLKQASGTYIVHFSRVPFQKYKLHMTQCVWGMCVVVCMLYPVNRFSTRHPNPAFTPLNDS